MSMVENKEDRESRVVKMVMDKWQNKFFMMNDGYYENLSIKGHRAAPDPEEREGLFDPKLIGKVCDDDDIRGDSGETVWGRCGNPSGSWPLTTFVEETDEYIVMSCDAGCTVTLIKNPPAKKRPKRGLMIVNGELVDSSDVKVRQDVPVDF